MDAAGSHLTPRYLKQADPDTIVRRRYLTTPEAATHLGLSPRTLEKHRCQGSGPIYRRLGGRVVYAIDDLDAWTTIGIRRSTSDPGHGTIPPVYKRPVKV